MAATVSQQDEVDVIDRTDTSRASVSVRLCLDWGCEDFGLPAAIELRSGGTAEFSCPHGRARCPLP